MPPGNGPLEGLAPAGVVRRRITTYTFLRILLATALFGLATVTVMQAPETVPYRAKFFALVAFTYLAMGTSAAILSRVERLELFVFVQLVLDAALISALIAMSGGVGSIFFVLYFTNIVAAAYLGYGRAALATAGVDAAFFLVVLALVHAGLFEGEIGLSDYPDVLLRIFGVILVGVLTARLAQRVRAADEALLRQKETTRALAEEYGLIVESVRSGILAVDAEGLVRGANSAAVESLGMAVGRPLQEVLPGLHESPERHEIRVHGPDGLRNLLCHRAPLGTEGAEVVVFDDVTRLRRMEAEMEREERLVGVAKIAAGIAHEIRNPLASLSGAIQLMDEEREGPLLDIALREVRRLDELVGDFLEIARPPRLQLRPVQIREVVDAVREAFDKDPRYGGQVRIETEIPDPGSLEPVILDPDRLKQVLWNLFLNAAQAMPDGGVIRVRLFRKPDAMHVQVCDHGVGIDPPDLEKLFDPFYTTRQGGTGLGLVTVDRLVRAHGGHVKVTSEPGEGTTFHLHLPLEARPEVDDPTAEMARPDSSSQRRSAP